MVGPRRKQPVRRPRCRIVAAILLGWLVAAGSTAAADLHVAADGSDADNDCSDPAMPCATVARAVDRAGSGDVIRIGTGEFEFSGILDRDVTLVGAGIDGTTLLPLGPREIAFDAASTSGAAEQATGLSFQHEVGAGKHRLALLFVTGEQGVGAAIEDCRPVFADLDGAAFVPIPGAAAQVSDDAGLTSRLDAYSLVLGDATAADRGTIGIALAGPCDVVAANVLTFAGVRQGEPIHLAAAETERGPHPIISLTLGGNSCPNDYTDPDPTLLLRRGHWIVDGLSKGGPEAAAPSGFSGQVVRVSHVGAPRGPTLQSSTLEVPRTHHVDGPSWVRADPADPAFVRGIDVAVVIAPSFRRVVEIGPAADVVLRDLAILRGRTPTSDGRGGAIVNAGTLTLDRVRVAGSEGGARLAGSASGGAGGIENVGTLALVDSEVVDNAAADGVECTDFEGSASWGGSAGGISNAGTLSLLRTLVARNRAGHGGDADGFGGGGGNCGGIASSGQLTIRQSRIADNAAGSGGRGNEAGANGGSGGGICSTASLTLVDSVVQGNSAGNGGRGNNFRGGDGGDGGGILSSGSLEIRESLIAFNRSGHGSLGGIPDYGVGGHGGGIATQGGPTRIVNSTFVGNQAGTGALTQYGVQSDGGDGGALFIGDGADHDLVHLTIVGNSGGTGDVSSDEVATGGVGLGSATARLRGSIVAGNPGGDGPPVDCGVGVVSEGYNLIGDGTGCPGDGPGDVVVDASDLIPVVGDGLPANHGGNTETIALVVASPAIDAIPIGACVGPDGQPVDRDQRGVLRPLDGDKDGVAACDIGAFELEGIRAVLEPSLTNPAVGSRIAVCARIDLTHSPQALGSYGAVLTWDPNVLTFAAAAGGSPPFDAPLVNAADVADGVLRLDQAAAGGATGSLPVACFEFDVTGPVGSATTLGLELTSVFAAGTFTDILPMTAVCQSTVEIAGTCTIGDVNGDASLDSGDALLILSADVGLSIPGDAHAALASRCGDTDGSGSTDPIDASIVLSHEILLPVDPSFPIGSDNVSFDNCDDPVPGAAGQAVTGRERRSREAIVPRLVPLPGTPAGFTRLSIALEAGRTGLGSYSAILRWDPREVEFVEIGGAPGGFPAPVVNERDARQGMLRVAQATHGEFDGRIELAHVLVRLRSKPRRPVEDLFEIEFRSLGASGPGFDNLVHRVSVP